MSAFTAQTSSSPTARSKRGALASERQSDHAQTVRREYERELLYAEVIEHLRAITGAQDVTQHELATRLGVSDARVSRTMSGRENLTLRTLADVGWALGMRFEMVAVPFEDRTDTPARDDPKPPRWLHRHAQLVARRVHDALKS